ncbi:hypothetical protein QP575_17815 [Alcaligenes faecalis subsp. phenolicus]|uniref:hypothetical protein n=1 Tax=Alcaligenes nematophilus TaxID=2994643 RepID=UPI002AA3B512|nr:hypothetical protein [Alcaligenes phenolicus]
MKMLTAAYTRAIHEPDSARQLQILEMCAQTENALAIQVQSLSDLLQNEPVENTRVGILPFCLPYAERLLPGLTRDFRQLLQIHASGLQHVVGNVEQLDPKSRAYHVSAELYLFQHGCHWFCKSRTIADARLLARHQVTHQKVLESVCTQTRHNYQHWQHHSSTT